MLRYSVSNALVYIIPPRRCPLRIDGNTFLAPFKPNTHINVFKLFTFLSSYLPSACVNVFYSHKLI